MFERIDEVTPERLRGPILDARERVIESRELMRIVRDLPVSIDLDAARLGDYDRDTVVRLFREYEFRTLIERLPALSGERVEETFEALKAETADGSFPAAQVAGRPAGWGPAPEGSGDRDGSVNGTGAGGGAGSGSGRAGPGGRPVRAGAQSELQLSLDFETLGRSAGGEAAPAHRVADAASLDAIAAADPRDALAAAIADPSRFAIVDAAGVPAVREWLATQPSVGASLVLDDPRPRRGRPLALALAGADGRTVVAEGARRPTLSGDSWSRWAHRS